MHAVHSPTPIRDTSATDRPLSGGRRRIRRWLIGGAIATVAVVVVVLAIIRWMSSELSVDAARLRTAVVERGTLVRDAAVTGKVIAAVSPTLHAPVAGTATVVIRAGDKVRKGDVVARVDSPDLAGELRRERSTLGQLEAEVGGARIANRGEQLTARKAADEAEIAYVAAVRELEGAERAFEGGVIAADEYNRAKDAVDTARVRRDHARASAGLSKQSAGFDLESARQRAERQRAIVGELERRVAELEIRSPVDGVIGTLFVADRAAVAANAPIATVVDLGKLEVELEVPEAYADDLGLAMTAEVKIGTATANGTISALSPEVVDNRVVVRVRFDGEQPAGLRQSQRVSARILIESRPDVLIVQRGPFVEAHGGIHAYVVDGDLAVRRAIRLGTASVSQVEILDGLKPGDRVVIAGSEDFADAGAVRIND